MLTTTTCRSLLYVCHATPICLCETIYRLILRLDLDGDHQSINLEHTVCPATRLRHPSDFAFRVARVSTLFVLHAAERDICHSSVADAGRAETPWGQSETRTQARATSSRYTPRHCFDLDGCISRRAQRDMTWKRIMSVKDGITLNSKKSEGKTGIVFFCMCIWCVSLFVIRGSV